MSAYDCTKSGEPRFASAQSKSPCFVGDRLEARICENQLRKSQLQIGFGAKEVSHAFLGIMWLASMEVEIEANAEIRNNNASPFFALHPRQMAICISVTLCRQSSMPTWRKRKMGDCFCASRISIKPVAGLNSNPAIYEDLEWIGLHWERPVRRQSEHWMDYRAALTRLEAMGLVYPSFESRAEIARLVAEREAQASWPRDPDGAPLYPGNAKIIPPDERKRRMESGRTLRLAIGHAGGAQARRGAGLAGHR